MRCTLRLAAAFLAAVFVAGCGGSTRTADDPFGAGSRNTDGTSAGRDAGGAGSGGGAGPVRGAGSGGAAGSRGGASQRPIQPQGPGPAVAGAADGPPAWVRVGHRLTWYGAAASVAQSRYAWVEDPNGPWEDPGTGKRYRRTDESSGGMPGEGQPGASGDGLVQVDVVAIEGSQVVLSTTLYTIDRSGSQLRFLWNPLGGGRVPGAAVDGTWIHPATLQQVLAQGFGGLLVLRGPFDLGGTRYDAISFTSGPGADYYSYTYDLATGILLAATTRSAGATSPLRAAGEAPPVGNSQLTITRFVGARLRDVPGQKAGLPAAVAAAGDLRYGGTYNWTNPLDPSSGNFTYPMEMAVRFERGGAQWRPYTARSVVANLGEQPAQQGVTGPIGPYGFDPGALAAVRAGQVLDQDPYTGEQLIVGGGGGAGTVVMESQVPGVFQRLAYDGRSGILAAYGVQLAPSGVTMQLQLQGP